MSSAFLSPISFSVKQMGGSQGNLKKLRMDSKNLIKIKDPIMN
ncbi:hypothetical protein LSS_12327 [Leptospira santarosai serovar Shermani str. LT 821]|uniref:Uncharacterized protein n=1 Tax=Leptospira santarosai serovar Shermani str. LT 821 TaxID=758847 RepID=K8Y7D6_9LEPT|nr:hypothetical protein LSS_12327 [Leptospira santarosai serovar Shermani str. LT 821]